MKIHLIVVACFFFVQCTHAVADWIPKSGFLQGSDNAGEVLQIKAAQDGKSFYTVSVAGYYYLGVYISATYTLRKWDVTTGKLLFSRSLIDSAYYRVCIGARVNCDGVTYTACGPMVRSPNYYGAFIRSIETDSLLFSIDSVGTASYISSLDYDSLEHALYISMVRRLEEGTYPNRIFSSGGSLSRIQLTDGKPILTAQVRGDCKSFKHQLGLPGTLYEVNRYSTGERGEGSKFQNICAILKGPNYVIPMYDDALHTINPNQRGLAIAPRRPYAANCDTTFQFRIYDDTQIIASKFISNNASDAEFTKDDRYMMSTNPSDSTLVFFNTSYVSVCGRMKVGFSLLNSRICIVPNSKTILFSCADSTIRRIDAMIDTLDAKQDILTSVTRQYVHGPVGFYPSTLLPEYSKYSWKVGNVLSTTKENFVHRFSNPGVYDYSCTISNILGTHSIEHPRSITIIDSLVPDFDVDTAIGQIPFAVHFIDKCKGGVLQWLWTFGDGDSSRDKSPNHVFKKPGSYKVTLTVNDGLRELTIIKNNFVVAWAIPTYTLPCKLVTSSIGLYYSYTSGPESHTETLRYAIPRVVTTTDGVTFFALDYNYSAVDVHAHPSGVGYSCRRIKSLYSLRPDDIDGRLMLITGTGLQLGSGECDYFDGALQVGRNGYITYMLNSQPKPISCMLNRDSNRIDLHWKRESNVFDLHVLENGIDAYAFVAKRSYYTDSSVVSFVRDTVKIAPDNIFAGSALAPVETPFNGRMMCVVSPLANHSSEKRFLQLRYYSSNGVFSDSLYMVLTTYEHYYDIKRLSDDRYLLCGFEVVSDRNTVGIIRIIDSKGNTILRRTLDEWSQFTKIVKLDLNTYALCADQNSGLPGFLIVKSNGLLIRDCRLPLPGMYIYSMDIGSNANTMYVSLQDQAYGTFLYKCNTNFVNDLNLDAEDIDVDTKTNSLHVYPNPASTNFMVEFNSAFDDTYTLELYTLFGTELFSTKVQAAAGTNYYQVPLSSTLNGSVVLVLRGAKTFMRTTLQIVH